MISEEMGFGGCLGTSDWEVKCAEDGNRNTECIDVFRQMTSWLSLAFLSNMPWISVSVMFSPILSIESTSLLCSYLFCLHSHTPVCLLWIHRLLQFLGIHLQFFSDMLISSSRHPYMTSFNKLSSPPKLSLLSLSHCWTPMSCAPNTTCRFDQLTVCGKRLLNFTCAPWKLLTYVSILSVLQTPPPLLEAP